MRKINEFLTALMKQLKDISDLNKPYALTREEWCKWHETVRSANPFKYFLLDTLPNRIFEATSVFTDAFKNSLRYIRYRWFDKLNIIHIKLPPGYYNADERLFYAAFELLVDYVEIEHANMYIAVNLGEVKTPWWYVRGLHLKTMRFPEYGLYHLKLDGAQLANTDRAFASREIWDLYHWWKFIRPNRVDPSEASGAYEWYKNKSPTELMPRELLTAIAKIEIAYEDEDEMQLMRLIAIRKHLWI